MLIEALKKELDIFYTDVENVLLFQRDSVFEKNYIYNFLKNANAKLENYKLTTQKIQDEEDRETVYLFYIDRIENILIFIEFNNFDEFNNN